MTISNPYNQKFRTPHIQRVSEQYAVPKVDNTEFGFNQNEYDIVFNPVTLGQLLCDYGADPAEVERFRVQFLPGDNGRSARVNEMDNTLEVYPENIWMAVTWRSRWDELELGDHEKLAKALMLIGKIFTPSDVFLTKPHIDKFPDMLMWHEAGNILDMLLGHMSHLKFQKRLILGYSMLPGYILGLAMGSSDFLYIQELQRLLSVSPEGVLLFRLALANLMALPFGRLIASNRLVGYELSPLEISANSFRDLIAEQENYRGILKIVPKNIPG